MHDNLDNHIKHHQPTGDEMVDLLNSTRPVGNKAHQDELEKRLLAQLQSNNERFHNMQAVHTGQLISFRKFPAILAAALTFLIIGGALLMLNLGDPSQESPGTTAQGSDTPTPVQEGCDTHNLRLIDFHTPVDIYGRDDADSEIIGTLDAGTVAILGANREGDWLVFLWDDSVVGWIHFSEMDERDYTIQECSQTASSSQDLRPTIVPPTSERPTPVPTPTPISVVDGTPLASPPVLRQYIESQESLIVYASDDDESEELAMLEEGDIVEVIGQNYDGEWLVVRLERGYVGWISLADEDKFTVEEGLIYADAETGELQALDVTATPTPSATPFPPTVPPPDNQ